MKVCSRCGEISPAIRRSGDRRPERLEEALVLGAGAVGDANVARAAEARAAADDDPPLAEAPGHLGLVALAERDPREVRLRRRRLQAEIPCPFLDEHPLDDGPLDPAQN